MRVSVLIPNLHCPRIGDTVTAVCGQTTVAYSAAPPHHPADDPAHHSPSVASESLVPAPAPIEPSVAQPSVIEIIVVGRDRWHRVPGGTPVIFDETTSDLTPAQARNRAAHQATGDLFLFLDADCVPEPGWLSALVGRQQAWGGVVGGALTFPADGYWSLADNIAAAHGLLPSTPAGPPRGFHLSAASLCLSRQAFQAVGGFDETLVCGEDFDLMMRLADASIPMYFEPAARAAHHHDRRSLGALLTHAARWAPDSVTVRLRHARRLGTPRLLRSPLALRLASPLVAAWVTARIWWRHPELLRHLHTAPAVWAAKVAWCWAAARRPLRGAA